MNYISKPRLSAEEKGVCEELVKACHQHDGTFHQPYLDNLYNFDHNMPAFILAEEGELAGFLSIYADEPGEAQLEIFVHPAHRRKGLASQLLREFGKIVEQYGLTDLSYVTEQVFIDQHPDVLSHFGLTVTDDRELWLVLPNQTMPLAERADVQVSLASMEHLESIAQFQAKAFEQELDHARHYARESIQNQEAWLYILQKGEQVLASVTVDVSQGSNHFFGLAVDVDHQGQGIGTYLLKSVINLLARENQTYFQIVVEKGNQAALNLYQKLGFETKTEVVYCTPRWSGHEHLTVIQ